MSEEPQDPTAEAIEETTPVATLDEQVPNVQRLFTYSRFVHVGEGAEECEGGEDGRCRKPEHFHAWVRLPNQFQQDTIASKARAARARAQRSLRDPESDLFVILEGDVSEISSREDAQDFFIETLTGVEDYRIRFEAMQWVEESDEEKWGSREADVYRRRELEAEDPEVRNQDELDELDRRTAEYVELVQARMNEVKAPKRQALEALTTEQLAEQYREWRIKVDADSAFTSAYNRYQWFICTMKPVLQGQPQERYYREMNTFDSAASEILVALRITFSDLEVALRASPAGNS